MALVEMFFVKTWYTVPRGNSTRFVFSCLNCEEFTARTGRPIDYSTVMNIPWGYYSNMQDLVDAMNTEIEERLSTAMFPVNGQDGVQLSTRIDREKWPKFKYFETKKRVNVQLQPGASMYIDPHLAEILGMSKDITNRTNISKMMGSITACDINGGIHSLYVYSDVLENVPVGDTEAPLLRVVDASGHSGENIHRTFDRPRYVPIQKKRFDSIEIDIKDDVGLPIGFEGGKLIVVLHFRRASSPYFST